MLSTSIQSHSKIDVPTGIFSENMCAKADEHRPADIASWPGSYFLVQGAVHRAVLSSVANEQLSLVPSD